MKNFIAAIRITMILSLGWLLWLNNPNHSLHGQAANITIVTSTDDTGPGTLRAAIENAVYGTEIRFDPMIFQVDEPASIFPEIPLPPLLTGGVTINGQGAGVILDGRRLGNKPNLAFLDDISFSMDGGPNLLLNGDFSPEKNLDHWHFWQAEDVDNFRWNETEGAIKPGSFEWTGTTRQQIFALNYSATEQSVNRSGNGAIFADITHDSFLDLDGAEVVELRFWHRHGFFITNIIFDTLNDGWIFHNLFTPSANYWEMAEFRVQVPENAIKVALQIQINPESYYGGLEIRSENNTIQGMTIVNFPGHAILIQNGYNNQIGGRRDISVESCLGLCNLISANMMSGIHIEEGGENLIQGNFFGVDRTGMAALPNRNANISIHASSSNQVGGNYSLGEGNLISSSGLGISISRESETPAAENNIIKGNLIGTNLPGTDKLGNEIGIILVGANQTEIGGNLPEYRNIISGNDIGVVLRDSSNSNLITGNYIGVSIEGLQPLGNRFDGVEISSGSFDNQIGGIDEGTGNIISGNGKSGIVLFHQETSSNVIEGNVIGSGKDTEIFMPNQSDGISIDYAQNNRIGPGNLIANNSQNGVNIHIVEGINTNSITQNSITGNSLQAIKIETEVPGLMPSASNVVVSARTISGKAQPASLIEVYQDPQEEAKTYLGSALADAKGDFHFTTRPGTTIKENITLLVSNPEQGTGSLSKPSSPPDSYLKEIPGFSGPEQISLEPQVILLNTGVAILAMVLFGIIATWFNETLECFSPELSTGFNSILSKFKLFRENKNGQKKRNRKIRLIFHWLIILAITAFIQSFLDPKIQFDRFWLGQIGTLIFSGLLITGIQIITEIILRRLSADKPDVKETEVSRIGLIIAAFSVGFSRLFNFSPGVVLGTVDGLYCTPTLDNPRQNAQRALTSKGVVLAISFTGWLISPIFSHSPGTQALLITMFVIGVQYTFFELFPLKVLDGYIIRSWNQWIWQTSFLISTFGFIYLVLNPDLGDLRAFRENQLVTLLIIAAFLVIMIFLMKVALKWLEKNVIHPQKLPELGKDKLDPDVQ